MGASLLTAGSAESVTRWSTTFQDDFSRDAPVGQFLDTYDNFEAYPYPWTDTSRDLRPNPGRYHPGRTLSASDGKLRVDMGYDAGLGRFLVGAVSPRMASQTYGRYTIRLRAVTRAPNYKVVPLLWPDSERWPADGELNMPEGELDGSRLHAYHHYARSSGGQQEFDTGVTADQWHTYQTVWRPGLVRFKVDGRQIGSTTRYVPNKPMHWVLQFETAVRAKEPAKSERAIVEVDWIKAERLNN